MELWDIYDKCFEKTGRLQIRGNKLDPGDYHLVVAVFPVNSKNQILIQRRNPNLKLMPGEWAATGGSAIYGETPFQAAKRELKEELGIVANKGNSELVGMLKRIDSFTSIWIVHVDVEIKDLKLQKEEVAEAKWVTVEQLTQMVKNGEFHNYRYIDWLLNYVQYMMLSPNFQIGGNYKSSK
jgi:8-oxo-dGTP pyrophosphatase MutT (NUDIX family)